MIDPLAIPNYERDFQLFPTRDNLHKIMAVFTHYLGRVCRGDFDKHPEFKERYRAFCMDMATRILCWFGNFKHHFISGYWMFADVPDVLRTSGILKFNEGEPFSMQTLELFEKKCSFFTDQYNYWIEINAQDRLEDGPVAEGVHIFGGMKVTGLQGGIAHHLMKKIYDAGGPTKALQKKLVLDATYVAIGMPVPKGSKDRHFDPHKARTKLLGNIHKIEQKTGVQFLVEAKVDGDQLVVTARSPGKKPDPAKKQSLNESIQASAKNPAQSKATKSKK